MNSFLSIMNVCARVIQTGYNGMLSSFDQESAGCYWEVVWTVLPVLVDED